MRGNARNLRRFTRRASAALGCLAIFAPGAVLGNGAEAHEVRFVASNGNNANACTRIRPCLGLQRGINSTPDGGELIVLDSGDFGSGVTIDKSITISAVGVSATLGGGITIDDPDATVVLRGLRLNGAGASGTGIHITAAAAVHIVDCEVENFGGNGIFANTSADVKVFVSGSVVRNNRFNGLSFATGAGGRLTVDDSRFEHNGINNSYSGPRIGSGEARISRTIAASNFGDGIRQSGGETNITWTTAAHNGGDGYRLQGGGLMVVEQSVARGNGVGLRVAQSGSIASLSNSVVTSNGTGLSVQAGSYLWTRESSTVSGNTTNVSGTLIALGGR